MTIKSVLKVVGVGFALATLGATAQAAGLKNIGTDRGGVVADLTGTGIPAPKAAKFDPHARSSSIYADQGSQWHTLIGLTQKAPSKVHINTAQDSYRNSGTDRGGVIRLR
ncbi:hypothetical protein [Roseibium sediminis]|uniref:hypothetical protein n=1 Tax=Roseibium sediminis TaxID=1775174 RepID=UPI00123D4843|nr:hypothetical protein [Roseibium sediminis]